VDHAQQVYNQLIDAGVARECARMILPLCTQTTLYMTGSVRSWIHYLRLRTKLDTQKEHREIAIEVGKVFAKEFPVIAKMLGMEEMK
jgi:thymidylate synthase (FAD)